MDYPRFVSLYRAIELGQIKTEAATNRDVPPGQVFVPRTSIMPDTLHLFSEDEIKRESEIMAAEMQRKLIGF